MLDRIDFFLSEVVFWRNVKLILVDDHCSIKS
jgi:hypothetical protein